MGGFIFRLSYEHFSVIVFGVGGGGMLGKRQGEKRSFKTCTFRCSSHFVFSCHCLSQGRHP